MRYSLIMLQLRFGLEILFFCYCLFKFGYVAVFDDAKFGKVFQPASLGGFDFYYSPTYAIIANPALPKSLQLSIGDAQVDNSDGVCEILKLTPDYYGIYDIVEHYAAKLAELDSGIDMSLINNKFGFFLGAKNKAMGESLKKMMDKINQGNPAVFIDQRVLNDRESKDTPFQFLQRDNLKQSYLTTDQLMDLHTLLSDFDAEIGIPTVPYQKKERETEYESKSKVADGLARVLTWERCINASLENVNRLYPELNITFRLRWKDELIKNNADRNESVLP